MGFFRSGTYLWLSTVLFFLFSVVSLFLLVRHLRLFNAHVHSARAKARFRQLRASNNSSQSMIIRFGKWWIHPVIATHGTATFIFLGLVITLWALTSRIMDLFQIKLSCRIGGYFSSTLWFLSRSNLYAIFISRLHLTFRDSIYRYRNETILGLYLIDGLFLTIGVILSPLLISEGIRRSVNGRVFGTQGFSVCVIRMHYSQLTAATLAAIDLIWSVLFSWLFCRPLRRLLSNTRLSQVNQAGTAHESKNQTLTMLPIKYSLLTGVACLSSVVMIVLTTQTSSGVFAVLNQVMVAGCLVMMTKHWSDWYDYLFGSTARWLADHGCCAMNIRRSTLHRSAHVKAKSFDSGFEGSV